MKLLKTAATIIFTLMALCSTLYAQSSTGEVNGTITDPSGAAVAGAVVKLINQSTQIETQVTTDQSGYFIFVNVKPAPYILTVEVQGFKGAQTGRFNVGVAASVTQNVALEVGELSGTVEVISGAELVQRSSSELGTVITEKAVQDLPLNGRNFTQLLTLAPGVTPVSTSQNRSIGGVEGNVGIPGSGFADPSFHGQ